MNKDQIKAVMFDFGDTLAYELKEGYLTYHLIFEELGYVTELSEFKKRYDEALEWMLAEREKGRIWTEETRADFVSRILTSLKLPSPSRVISKIIEIYPYRVQLKAFEDTEPTLSQLKHKKFKLIICSNVSSERNLRIFLKSVNLESYFDIIVASGTVGYEKPNPEIFKIASKLSNTRPERMIHIGDLYEYDYVGAESAGMRALLIDRNEKYRGKKINVIYRLDDIFDYI
ncbi:MAG: HAD family hydrolase [Nitrososphaeria archaeon]|jgi:putative hydrolase of the HAD superfamily